ncbi:unnamed protein product [Blepharisma stoltei]|uniref:Tyrosine-protein kinase ephrin type A/B receptor-like domain-containing protein n=1 Tax=Blepharisma stoltei TaxID=1481888 RepID=A0AAU9JAA8_9CILI|nr:unnamed protein product [Blepharisma stoltei]
MLFYLCLLFYLVSGLHSVKIPKTGSPPKARKYSSATYDSHGNRMIIFAGSSDQREYYNDIWSFNFDTLEWSELNPSTPTSPSPRVSPAIFYDENENRIIVFGGKTYLGIASEIWSFNLDFFIWEQLSFSGSKFYPTTFAASCSLIWNNKKYHSIFGGETTDSVYNRLYLLDLQNTSISLMPNNGNSPNLMQCEMACEKDSIYVWGGISANFVYNTNLYAYNLTSQWWTKVDISGNVPLGRIFHSVKIYSGFFYVLPGFNYNTDGDQVNIWRINLTSVNNWESVAFTNSSTSGRSSAASIFVNSSLYQFSGSTVTNDLILMDLSLPVPYFETISSQWTSPPPRMRFSMVSIESYLIVFGGMGGNDELLNDLWIFDIEKELWSSLETAVVPSARSGQATAQSAFGMTVFGGEDSTGLLNDMYIFSFKSQRWSLIPSTDNNVPSPRKGACMYVIDRYAVLFGGISNSGYVNDIWRFDIYDLSWTDLSPYDSSVPAMAWHQCLIKYDGASFNYYAFFGQIAGAFPNKSIYGFNLDTKSWALFKDFKANEFGLAPSEATVAVLPDYMVIIGGEFSDFYVSSSISTLSIKNFTILSVEYMDIPLFSHQSAYFADKLYIFGGSLSINTLLAGKLTSGTLFKMSFENSLIRYPCSKGSYLNNSQCLICQPGSYSEEFDSTECTKCPKGTFLDDSGGQAASLCIPCRYGSYSDELGTELCKNCPAGMQCDVGSTEPMEQMYLPSEFSNQPKQYEGDVRVVNYWSLILEIIISVLIFLIVFLAFFSKKFWDWVARVDIFDTQHNKDNEPMIKRKTSVGGLFSLMALLWAGFLVVLTTLQIFYDNITETKALIPYLFLAQEAGKLSADIKVVVSLYNYGGNCTVNDSCANGISLSWTDTAHDDVTLNCYFTDKVCYVFSECKSCVLSSSSSLTLSLYETNSYASYFSVNVTSDSSIPGESSSYATYIHPPEGTIFIGPQATSVDFIMTPCLFLAQSSDKNNQTGNLVSFDKYVLGSTGTVESMTYNRYFEILVNFNVDISGLLIVRTLNMDFLLFWSSVFGSVGGIIEVAGHFMEHFEEGYNDRKEKKQLKEEREKRIYEVEKFKSIFHSFADIKGQSKQSTFDLENASEADPF